MSGLDSDIVAAMLEPLNLRDLVAALDHAGFSGDVYRRSFADLNASLEDDAAGTLHFLRHGYSEGRIFPVQLNLAGLDRLRHLGVRNRIYLQNLFVAVITAWIGTNVRNSVDLATHGPTIEHLRAMGALPLVILGDAFAGSYRRGSSIGMRWICPLALMPLEGGIDELLRTAPSALLAAQPDLDVEAIPVLWAFGQVDIEHGYLAHRLRNGIGTGDMDAFHDFAMPLAMAYMEFVAGAVPREEFALHWIAGPLPPARQATDQGLTASDLVREFGRDLPEKLAAAGVDSLLDRTLMHQSFNGKLEQAAANRGFNFLHTFDYFLAGHGVVDDQYLAGSAASLDLNHQRMRGVIASLLWSIVYDRRITGPSGSIREQFVTLLEEIRLVQLGE